MPKMLKVSLFEMRKQKYRLIFTRVKYSSLDIFKDFILLVLHLTTNFSNSNNKMQQQQQNVTAATQLWLKHIKIGKFNKFSLKSSNFYSILLRLQPKILNEKQTFLSNQFKARK